jgi:hypothetical protein
MKKIGVAELVGTGVYIVAVDLQVAAQTFRVPFINELHWSLCVMCIAMFGKKRKKEEGPVNLNDDTAHVIQGMSNAALLRMLCEKSGDYLPEAIDFAKAEATRRGINALTKETMQRFSDEEAQKQAEEAQRKANHAEYSERATALARGGKSKAEVEEDLKQGGASVEVAASIAENVFALRPKTHRDIGKRNTLSGALWFIGGVLVTVATYRIAAGKPGGGMYIIAWGAMIFGAVQFVCGLAQRIEDPLAAALHKTKQMTATEASTICTAISLFCLGMSGTHKALGLIVAFLTCGSVWWLYRQEIRRWLALILATVVGLVTVVFVAIPSTMDQIANDQDRRLFQDVQHAAQTVVLHAEEGTLPNDAASVRLTELLPLTNKEPFVKPQVLSDLKKDLLPGSSRKYSKSGHGWRLDTSKYRAFQGF